ncbi:Ku protein [Mycobacterium sherrisii]|uniref:non-homologous end joining protein Ku n=1 Tax=Mycobacterium sherrisii TaxID=243061 RepID=UPI002DDD2131|nr:Ku protein [Mycobacterium sherrisii]MEC4763798.1 Ku protein [Mycobacterium sherrisii]
MRSKWNTTLDLGLLSVAVKTFAARDFGGAQLHQYHEGCGGEVGRQAYCKTCGAQPEWSAIVKGAAREDGEVVLVTDDELDEIRGEATGYEILKFVPAEQISPLILDGGDYLEPDVKRGKGAAKAYVLLRDALIESDRVGVVRYTHRGVSHIAVLRVHHDHKTLVLQNMVWSDQLRAPQFEILDKPVTIAPKEAKLARELVESMLGDFNHADYVDEYAASVNELIDDKAAGVVPEPSVSGKDTDDDPADVSDLLAKLEASVKAREDQATAKTRHPSKARRRKTA